MYFSQIYPGIWYACSINPCQRVTEGILLSSGFRSARYVFVVYFLQMFEYCDISNFRGGGKHVNALVNRLGGTQGTRLKTIRTCLHEAGWNIDFWGESTCTLCSCVGIA